MSGRFVLRRCRTEDIPGILEVEGASFPDPYDRFTFAQLLAAPRSVFLVAEAGDRLLGYVVASVEGSMATIASVATVPGRRRQGVGTALMRSALDGLAGEGVGQVQLQVDVDNRGAIAFYIGLGFQQAGRLRRYYRNGHDAFLMALDLAQVSRASESRDRR